MDTAFPPYVPGDAIRELAAHAGGRQPETARVLVRWNPGNLTTDWIVLVGNGTPEEWYYSPTPVGTLSIPLPDAHDVDQALGELGDDVTDDEWQAAALAIVAERVEEREATLADRARHRDALDELERAVVALHG